MPATAPVARATTRRAAPSPLVQLTVNAVGPTELNVTPEACTVGSLASAAAVVTVTVFEFPLVPSPLTARTR